MRSKIKQAFLIAAPRSNSGKTLLTLGLIKAFKRKGYNVQPFKCGPDYIDPMHHKAVSGNPSYNLDTWMASQEHVRNIFSKQMLDANMGIAEGVMGLFDGAQKDKGSSAEIARLLSLPVVLVVDASSVAYSVAPLLYGFKKFDPHIRIAGVIFNKVGSETHARILQEGAQDAGVEMLGYIPRDRRLAIESRHLGLHLPGENQGGIIEIVADLIDENVNLDRLVEISQFPCSKKAMKRYQSSTTPITTAVAYDEAFNFTYQANLDILNEMGEVKFFSPLVDKELPTADLVWFPGGYPELFAEALSKNTSMLASVKEAIESHMPVIAECGGMMYLGKGIIDKEGQAHNMTGVFDFSTTFQNMKLHLGYREVSLTEDLNIRGHEFHFSEIINEGTSQSSIPIKSARSLPVEMPVFQYKNCWASYMHLYMGNGQTMLNFLNYLKHEQ